MDAFYTYVRIKVNANFTDIVPNNNTQKYDIGTNILFGASGDGTVTFEGADGVTILSPESLTINKKYGKVTFIKVEENVWEIEGNLKPVE